jgi:hypothetical protein
MTMFDEHGMEAREALSQVVNDAVAHEVVGSTIDLKGYNACTFLLHLGALAPGGSGTYKVYESDSSTMVGETEATVALGSLANDPVAITDAMDHTVHKIGYIGIKRYVRLKLTTVGATAKDYSALAILEHKRH